MLSSVLRSGRAAEVNVAIIRTYDKMRKLLTTNEVIGSNGEET